MKGKKIIFIIGIIMFVLGVGTCFAVSTIFSKDEEKEADISQKLEVRIERAGVCNPLQPVEEKIVSISEKNEIRIQKYWEKTDKTKMPDDDEICECIIGDYKIVVGEDEFLFNLDIGYVSYKDKLVDINDNFYIYLQRVITENDEELE